MKRAFSLVELSIVLVILGLLVGGILAGQSLIRASELRSVSADISRYTTAAQSFRDKYFAVPGDMANATQFWGAANTSGTNGQCADPLANAGTGTQTCNGNGNATVDNNETYRFWQHLANAGLIEGSYTGVGTIDATPYPTPTIGTNVPKSKLGSNGYGLFVINGYNINIDQGHDSYMQSKLFLGSGAMYSTASLSTTDAWNIDTKMDDGSPALGMVQAQLSGSHTAALGCMTTADATAQYVLSNTGLRCAPSFKILP